MAEPQIDPRLAGEPVSAAASYQTPSSHPYYSTYPSDSSTVQDHPTGGTAASGDSAIRHGSQSAYPNSPGSHSDANSPTGDNSTDPKRPRACDSCRSLKVRCDQESSGEPCKRCKKANRQCVVSEATRKRTRKADSRVAELEKKIDALTASLQAQGQGRRADQMVPGDFPGGYAEADKLYRSSTDNARGQKRRRTDDTFHGEPTKSEPLTPGPFIQSANPLQHAIDPAFSTRTTVAESESSPHYPGPNVPFLAGEKAQDHLDALKRIDRLVDREQQNRIFTKYHKEMSPQVPVVVFPEDTTADEIRPHKPHLFLAILHAGSVGILSYEAQAAITEELIQMVADDVVKKGEKSLELVQAIQITCFWFKPPPKTDMTNYYQLIHLAAVMAIDLGLGRPQSASRTRNPHYRRITYPNSETVESRRAWLGCYFLCASTSMILRRPNLLKWDSYIEQCIEVLQESKETAPTDRLLCAYMKIQYLSETIGVEFGMNDPSAQISINDQKVKYQINEFERKLKHFRHYCPKDVNAPALELSYHVCNLYLHEIVMHVNHNIDDFRVPVTEESLKGSIKPSNTKLTSEQINAITECQNGAIGVLETYCSMEWKTVQCLPMFLYFVRIVYAFVILLKLYFAATDPESEIGKLIDPKGLRIDEFLDKVNDQIRPISSSETYRPYAKVLFILGKLRDWYYKHKDGLPKDTTSGQESLKSHSANDGSVQQPQYGNNPGDSGLQLLSSVATSSSEPTSSRAQSASVGSYGNGSMPPPRQQQQQQQQQQAWPGGDQSWQNGNFGFSNATTTGGLSGSTAPISLDPSLMHAHSDPSQLQFPPGLMDSLYWNWGTGFEESMDMTMNSWVEDLGKDLGSAEGVWPSVPVEEGQRM